MGKSILPSCAIMILLVALVNILLSSCVVESTRSFRALDRVNNVNGTVAFHMLLSERERHPSVTPKDHMHTLLQSDIARIPRLEASVDDFEGRVGAAGAFGFYTTIPVGTPPQIMTFLIDTGSSLSWLQDSSCHHCYGTNPGTANYNSKGSSTFRRLTCADEICMKTVLFERKCKPDQGQGICWYRIKYGSGAVIDGIVSAEEITMDTAYRLPHSITIPNFIFGQGLYQYNNFNQDTAGILGLGRDSTSLISQLAASNLVSRKFGYCLPNIADVAYGKKGSLVLGDVVLQGSTTAQYTTLATNTIDTSNQHLYYVNVINIYVNDVPLPIPIEVFRINNSAGYGGTVIDSGTTYSWLVPAAFDPLANAYNQLLLGRLYNPPNPTFSLCASTQNLDLPSLTYEFEGGAKWNISNANSWGWVKRKNGQRGYGLLIKKNKTPNGKNFFGNRQQRDYWVVYDDTKSQLAFQPASCAIFAS